MYTTSSYSSVDSATLDAINAMAGTYSFITGIISVLAIVAMWKIFTKAGVEGWKSLIPVYNSICLYKIIGLSPWLLLLLIIPIVNIVAAIVLGIMQASRLAKAFGKSGAFAVGLFLLSPIFMLILAFSDAEYVGVEG